MNPPQFAGEEHAAVPRPLSSQGQQPGYNLDDVTRFPTEQDAVQRIRSERGVLPVTRERRASIPPRHG
jgi:hypothetical protein